MVWNGSIVKLLGVDCSFNCFDVGRVSCWHGTWRLASSSGWHLSPSKRARFNTVSCPWTRVAELGRDAAHVGGDLLSFEHLAAPAAECPSWVSFSIQHGPTRCQRRSLIPRAFTAVDDCGGFTGRLGWSHGNTSWRDVVAKEAFASQRKVIADSQLVRVWLSFVSSRMRILWSLLSLELPVLVNKCWLNSGFPSLTRSWQLQCWLDWTCIVSRWFWLGSHFARGTSYAEWIDSGAAGFVQARPFNLWRRMRVGPQGSRVAVHPTGSASQRRMIF